MEQPSKRIKVVAADEDEAGGAAAEVDAAVASAASPTDNLEKLVRSLKSYPLMEKVLFFPLPLVPFAEWARPAGSGGKQTCLISPERRSTPSAAYATRCTSIAKIESPPGRIKYAMSFVVAAR